MLLTRTCGVIGSLIAFATTSVALDEPVRNARQAVSQSGGNATAGTTIEYGYDSNVEYDYVVVGSGAGGGPLASRLAIAGNKVLLIEAGGDAGNDIVPQVPALMLQSTEYIPQQWDYFVHHYDDLERQKKDTKMVYRKTDGEKYVGLSPPSDADPLGILYPRAGTLGGCSAHNAMISVYPFDDDWKYIQKITGDSTWAPSKMRSYFQKLEDCQYLPSSAVGHGYNGWLKISLTSLFLVVEDQKLLSLVVSAATAMGKGLLSGLIHTVTDLAKVLTKDLNSGNAGRDGTESVYQIPLAVDADTLKRAGPRDFILSVANAKASNGGRKYHLDVALNTFVTKINFDTSGNNTSGKNTSSNNPRATGVQFIKGQSIYAADPRYSGAKGTQGSVDVKKEVIISAGTFETPKLLKLSGVGPKEELDRFGIKVVKDLPGVGTNLQDRYEVGVIGEARTDFTITKDCTFGYTTPDPCLEKWKNGRTVIGKGVYATSGIAVAATKKSSTAGQAESSNDPDLFIAGAPANFKGYFPGYAYDALKDARHWVWIILKARARNNAGTVSLVSTDPQQMPKITMNSLDTGVTADGADEKDLQALYEGVQFGRRAFDKVVPLDGSFTETWPGANVSSEADVKQFIKNEAWGHHASCTCPIGSDNDPMAVLDSNFKVRGVDALRVVDASVFPKIPGYYIAVPIYMISEKAADVIIKGS